MKSNGRTLIVAPADYPGTKYQGRYAYEHRVIWWQHYKDLPPKGWHIHHINGNPLDNRIENLESISAHEHAKDRHHGGKEIATYTVLECHACKVRFEQLTRTVNFRLSKGQSQFFCCKSHQVTYQNQFRKGKNNNYPKNRKSVQDLHK